MASREVLLVWDLQRCEVTGKHWHTQQRRCNARL
jgi:hypothetical protein